MTQKRRGPPSQALASHPLPLCAAITANMSGPFAESALPTLTHILAFLHLLSLQLKLQSQQQLVNCPKEGGESKGRRTAGAVSPFYGTNC